MFFTSVRDVRPLMAPDENRFEERAERPVLSRSSVFNDVKLEKLKGNDPPAFKCSDISRLQLTMEMRLTR